MLPSPQWAVSSLARLFVDGSKMYAVAMGFTILIGGAERMAAPAFMVILQWAPWWVWGITLLAAGIISYIPVYVVRCLAHGCCAAWFWIWTAALFTNAFFADHSKGPAAPLTGLPTYFAAATVFTATTVALWMTREDWSRAVQHAPRKAHTP
jgi:hypothetical protein